MCCFSFVLVVSVYVGRKWERWEVRAEQARKIGVKCHGACYFPSLYCHSSWVEVFHPVKPEEIKDLKRLRVKGLKSQLWVGWGKGRMLVWGRGGCFLSFFLWIGVLDPEPTFLVTSCAKRCKKS